MIGYKSPRYRYIKVLFLFFLFFSLIILYNTTNIFYNNWFLHPDDYGDWVISENLFRTGEFTYKEPLNKIGEFQLFVPVGTRTNIDGEILPKKAFGSYIFYSFGFLFGYKYPFYLISFFGILGMLFFFLLTREILNEKTAFISTFLLGLSFPVIYWSNMLFSNIISFSFFIMALYLLVKMSRHPNKPILYLLSFYILSLSFFVRYEYLFFVILLSPLFFNGRYNRKYILMGLVISIVFISQILILNDLIFENPFSTGATTNSISSSAQNQTVSDPVIKLVKMYFVHLIVPDVDLLINNFNSWMYLFFEPLFSFILLGLIILSKERKNLEYWLPFISITLFWGYYVLNANYWGVGKDWLSLSYARYLLVPYSFLVILASKFLLDFFKYHKTNRNFLIVLLFLVTVAYFLNVNNMLWFGKYGLKETIEEKEFYFSIDRTVDSFPENSIIVGNIISKAIISKKVLNYGGLVDVVENNSIISAEPISKEKKNLIVQEAIKTLIQEGYVIYIIEIPWHDYTYIDLSGNIKKNIQTLNITMEKIDRSIYFRGREIYIYKLSQE